MSEATTIAPPAAPTTPPRASYPARVTTPESRAATSAAIGALTDFLLEQESGGTPGIGRYLQQLVDEDGVGVLAQGYYGLLDLSALLLAMAAEEQDLDPRELLRRIALDLARDDH